MNYLTMTKKQFNTAMTHAFQAGQNNATQDGLQNIINEWIEETK